MIWIVGTGIAKCLSADLAAVVGEQRYLLSYLSSATFGYTYQLSGQIIYLVLAIYLLWGASKSIQAAEKKELLDMSSTTWGRYEYYLL